MVKHLFMLCTVVAALLFHLPAQGAEDVFAPGRIAYQAGQFTNAARFFQGELKRAPSAEAWHNFGNAAWQAGHAGEAVLSKHLPVEIRSGAARGARSAVELPADGVKLEDVERELVRLAVERAGGNQTQAAELLGIERDALRRRLQKFNLMP